MKSKTAYKISMSAMFTALIFVATYFIAIPMPAVGYVNLGDAFIILTSILLGPLCGAICGGVGAMLADLMLGYAIYAPATLIVKALMAIGCFFVYKAISKIFKKPFGFALASIVAEIIMILGYFLFEGLVVIGFAGAFANVLFNSIQGGLSIIVSNILLNILLSNKFIKSKISTFK